MHFLDDKVGLACCFYLFYKRIFLPIPSYWLYLIRIIVQSLAISLITLEHAIIAVAIGAFVYSIPMSLAQDPMAVVTIAIDILHGAIAHHVIILEIPYE